MDAQLSLLELLEGIQDPRGAKGKRHPLSALLALAVVDMLAGMTSYEAIVQYGKSGVASSCSSSDSPEGAVCARPPTRGSSDGSM